MLALPLLTTGLACAAYPCARTFPWFHHWLIHWRAGHRNGRWRL